MGAALAVLKPLAFVNEHVLRIGRGIGIVAVALMVVAILVQVFFRYVLNNALPWPDEAARFCMLWMTGLMAPTAFRRGGFVSIDMAVRALPKGIGALVTLFLLLISLSVLVVALEIGWSEVTGFGGKFATASLYVPTDLGFGEWMRVPRSWMMASLLVGVTLMISVNVELILRAIFGDDYDIGMVVIDPVNYDHKRWYAASGGVKAVLNGNPLNDPQQERCCHRQFRQSCGQTTCPACRAKSCCDCLVEPAFLIRHQRPAGVSGFHRLLLCKHRCNCCSHKCSHCMS